MVGTRAMEDQMSRRGLGEIQKGFSNISHPHRQLLVEKIGAFMPVSNALEIGCGYGPNLALLARRYPQTDWTGIDINHLSISEGQRLLANEGLGNVKLVQGKADGLSQFPGKGFDIVFTDALLIFIGPDKINGLITEMFRVARRALVLVEWHCESQDKDPKGSGTYHYGCWKRNYVDLLQQFVPGERIRLTKIPGELWPVRDWQEFGYVIEILIG